MPSENLIPETFIDPAAFSLFAKFY